ncbi:hypothetical protein FB382_001659 [Nocardioides ginsengisegetis]|uniref:Uncharacterized protein n=1 Tax=Nocardioides ginsengisegetis TaxID=661491 RepID=A0A7W3P9B2_9ACTN|nr:hypothetical protein [Nocardioides ginsengisegetis]MBA8803368.1 hypothetical protein [Nocardioides ginsengisegetis]
MEPEIVRLLVDALTAEEEDRRDLRRVVVSASDFDSAVRGAHLVFPEWRLGQTSCNVLRAWRPDLYLELAGTEVDPFYRDDLLPEFHRWLADRTAGD